jgi:hypothetical protein
MLAAQGLYGCVQFTRCSGLRGAKTEREVGLEVLTAASMRMFVFWVVAPCRLVEGYRCFRGICALMMEAASTSETSVKFFQTTQRYNLEDKHLKVPKMIVTVLDLWSLFSSAVQLTSRVDSLKFFTILFIVDILFNIILRPTLGFHTEL